MSSLACMQRKLAKRLLPRKALINVGKQSSDLMVQHITIIKHMKQISLIYGSLLSEKM